MTTGRSSTGRSPAPPRGSSAAAAVGGRPSLDAMRGRLSYGTAESTTPAAAASSRSNNADEDVLSPDATAGNTFLAALSPKNNTTASQAAAASAMNTAAMAARGAAVARNHAAAKIKNKKSTGPAAAVEETNDITKGMMTPSLLNYLAQIGQDNESIQLRYFVQSLLGMHLPAATSSSNTSNNNTFARMTTPDPTTAAFYAQALYAKTNGRRPDDAYLAARAMSLKGEGKRAIWILDKSGLIGFGVGTADHGDGNNDAIGNSDVDGLLDQSLQHHQQQHYHGLDAKCSIHNISNKEGIRNALLLRTEAALLAGQCLVQAGEYERAIAVYEEAMRFPPPPPPVEWGLFGYGYRVNHHREDHEGGTIAHGDEEDELDSKLADEMYIRQWREQSLSHMALIDDGDDERLFRLADNIQSVQFSSSQLMMEGIHPMSRLCSARGVAYDEISNPHRAVPFLRMALTIDARCIEAL
ncbi:hypothetical protein ACHAXM_001478, partial [Skeletonema potamos]